MVVKAIQAVNTKMALLEETIDSLLLDNDWTNNYSVVIKKEIPYALLRYYEEAGWVIVRKEDGITFTPMWVDEDE